MSACNILRTTSSSLAVYEIGRCQSLVVRPRDFTCIEHIRVTMQNICESAINVSHHVMMRVANLQKSQNLPTQMLPGINTKT
eukprot:1872770-Amphidinium_carterae.1